MIAKIRAWDNHMPRSFSLRTVCTTMPSATARAPVEVTGPGLFASTNIFAFFDYVQRMQD